MNRDSGIVEMFHVRDVLLAGNIAWVTAVFGIVALPQTLVEFRQHGVFRRYRVTSMPTYMLIVAPLAVGAAVIVVSLALMLVVGWLLFDIRFAGNAAMVALAIFVSYMAFAALGAAITARIRNVRTALGLGLALFAPMFVLSGAFGPRETFPAALRVVGDWLPLTHWVSKASENVLANWPAEMSHSPHGECDFDAQRTDETSDSEQPNG